MVKKITGTQKTKKLMKKTANTSARKAPLKSKQKSVQKRKTLSGKPVAQKSVPKKTTVKKKVKVKPVTQRKTGTPQQRAAKKKSVRNKPKIPRKTAAPVRTRTPRKRAVQTSEEERKLGLRRSLIQKREELVREVKNEISKYIKGETRQLVDTALDDGDWSVVDLSEDISFKHMSTHRENLLKIDEALRKLSEGTYGICEDCGEEISEQRLKILPFAIYCTDCQERREQIEELEKREGLIG